MVTELPLRHAFLDGGVERVSWWNGRVLTAEDLADHQLATDHADRRLGRAIGAGVVDGLVVTPGGDGRSVEITAGLAVDRAGEVLELPQPVTVPLVGSGSTTSATDEAGPAGFVVCGDELPVTHAGHGAYLLTVASAAGTRGAAAGADVRGIATRDCGPRYAVAGVQFRLASVNLAALAEDRGHDAADLDVLAGLDADAGDGRARNLVAAVLLDVVPRRRALLDPFGSVMGAAPVLDLLHEQGVLVDCEVPLAALTWQGGSLGFVDVWAARRPAAPRPTTGTWPQRTVGEPGVTNGLVTLLQFVDHLADLVGPGVSAAARVALRARERFRYVPPATLLPLVGAGRPRGVTLEPFLTGVERRGGGQIAAGRVWPLVRASLLAPPIDLDVAEGLRTYTITETVGVSGIQHASLLAADHLTHLAVAPEEDLDRMVITGVSPAGSHPVRAEITVHGRNFAVPSSHNHVTVGGVEVLETNPGSSDTALVFNVPAVPTPGVVPLVVTKGDESAEWFVHVVEEHLAPEGELHLTEDLGDLDGEVEAGETYTFRWLASLRANVGAEFRFEPRFSGAQGATVGDWASAAIVVGEDDVVQDTFRLEPLTDEGDAAPPVTVGVRLTVPDDARRVDLQLVATCLAAPDDPQLSRPSSPVTIEVGAVVEHSDPRITFEQPETTQHAVLAPDGAVEVRGMQAARVDVVANLAEAGTFTYDAALEPDTGPWTLSHLVPGSGDQPFDADGGTSRELSLRLQASATGPSADRTLRVTVTQVGDAEPYASFTRLRIRSVP